MAKLLGIAVTATVLAWGLGCTRPVSSEGTGTQPTGVSETKPDSGHSKLASRLEAARAISFMGERDKALAAVAKDAAEAGEAEIVKESINGIQFLDLRDQTKAACALKLNERGHGAAAVEVAKSIQFMNKRDEVLAQLAKATK